MYSVWAHLEQQLYEVVTRPMHSCQVEGSPPMKIAQVYIRTLIEQHAAHLDVATIRCHQARETSASYIHTVACRSRKLVAITPITRMCDGLDRIPDV